MGEFCHFLDSLKQGRQINDFYQDCPPHLTSVETCGLFFTYRRKLFFLQDPQNSEVKMLSSKILYEIQREISIKEVKGIIIEKG